MSKKENKTAVKINEVKNITVKTLSNKESYDKCNTLLITACKAIQDVIKESAKESNSIPTSTVARFVHLLGKLDGSRKEQFIVKFGQIEKRLAKEQNKIQNAIKKAKKTAEKQTALLEQLSPEQKEELRKMLAVQITA